MTPEEPEFTRCVSCGEYTSKRYRVWVDCPCCGEGEKTSVSACTEECLKQYLSLNNNPISSDNALV